LSSAAGSRAWGRASRTPPGASPAARASRCCWRCCSGACRQRGAATEAADAVETRAPMITYISVAKLCGVRSRGTYIRLRHQGCLRRLYQVLPSSAGRWPTHVVRWFACHDGMLRSHTTGWAPHASQLDLGLPSTIVYVAFTLTATDECSITDHHGCRRRVWGCILHMRAIRLSIL
jgi:hypothetical protein